MLNKRRIDGSLWMSPASSQHTSAAKFDDLEICPPAQKQWTFNANVWPSWESL